MNWVKISDCANDHTSLGPARVMEMPSRLSPALTPGFPEDFDMLDAQTDI